MNILFLDIDGVLNSENWFRSRKRTPSPTDWQWKLDDIDPGAVANLARILEQVHIQRIVWSSVWRRNNSPLDLAVLLRERGLTCPYSFDVDSTPVLNDGVRGMEIQAYLDGLKLTHPIIHYVIVDDDSDMAHLLPKLVKTSSKEGLTKAKAQEVIKRFSLRK